MAEWLQPLIKSMILCEDVLPGPAGSGNVHLMNVFGAIQPSAGSAFPYRFSQLCVFLQLTDAEGEGGGSIKIRSAEDDQLVFTTAEHRIQFADRLQLKWVLFRIKDCTFPASGVYFIEFYLDGRWIVDRAVRINE